MNYLETSARRHYGAAIFAAVIILLGLTTACSRDGSFSKSEREECERYNHEIYAAQDSSNIERQMQLSKEFYDVSQKGHTDLFRAYAAANYAQMLMVTGKPDEGKKVLDEVMKRATAFSHDTVMADVCNGYAIYEMMKNQNQYAAIEYSLKSLEYARKCNDKHTLLAALTNLAHIMLSVCDTTGLRYAQEAYELAKESGQKEYMSVAALSMIGQMKCVENSAGIRKWMKVYLKTMPSARAVHANNILSEISLMDGDYAKAHHYIDLAIAEADTAKNALPVNKIEANYTKAMILYEEGRYKESLEWTEKTMNLARELGDMSLKKNLLVYYSRNYRQLGNYREALRYQDEFLKDEFLRNNANYIKILKAKEVALDVAKKDAQIKQQQEHARMLRWFLNGALTACLLLALLCLYINKMYRREHKLMQVVVDRARTREEKEDEMQKQAENQQVELFKRIKDYIEGEEQYKNQSLSRDTLAEHLDTNRTYITEAVKAVTGMSFPQYISSLRVSEAERLLHDKDADVSNLTEMAHSLGFNTLAAFQVAFKKQTGMTLSAYRVIARNGRGGG